MANDTYTANADGSCYVGRFNLPSWVRSQPLNTWGVVPTTNVLADLNPRNNPLLNPVFPSKPEWEALGSFTAIVSAWCGATYNADLSEIRIPLIAGHADYAGGESYNIYLKSEAPTWVMMHPPTGALPDAVITDDGQENTGLYANGRPRAIHTYNKCIWVPTYGHLVVPQGNCSVAANGGTLRALHFNQDTGLMDLFGADLGVGSPGDYSGGATCWDDSRQCVWIRRVGTGRFHRYFPASNTWQADVSNSIAVSGNNAMEYIPEHDCIVWLNTTFSDAGEVGVLNCATGVITRKAVSGTVVGTNLRGLSQPRRINSNQFAFWHNATNTTDINVLEFDTDPIAGNWSVSQLPVDVSNVVTPTVAASNGTYGRFIHDDKLGIFAVINAVSQPIYFYRYK